MAVHPAMAVRARMAPRTDRLGKEATASARADLDPVRTDTAAKADSDQARAVLARDQARADRATKAVPVPARVRTAAPAETALPEAPRGQPSAQGQEMDPELGRDADQDLDRRPKKTTAPCTIPSRKPLRR